MATRLTAMKGRSGTKAYAVGVGSGPFRDNPTGMRAHAGDRRRKSTTEKTAARGPVETKVRKPAKAAVKSVKAAVAAVERSAERNLHRSGNGRHHECRACSRARVAGVCSRWGLARPMPHCEDRTHPGRQGTSAAIRARPASASEAAPRETLPVACVPRAL